jgi:hypothetical protein
MEKEIQLLEKQKLKSPDKEVVLQGKIEKVIQKNNVLNQMSEITLDKLEKEKQELEEEKKKIDLNINNVEVKIRSRAFS